MSDKAPKKEKGMTVFRTDRHEDLAAIVFSGIVVASVLFYMAFLNGPINFKAPADGTILSIAVSENAKIKKGDVLMTMETREKKMVHGQMEEKVVQKPIKSKMDGSVIQVASVAGKTVSKDKDLIMVLEAEKGTLP